MGSTGDWSVDGLLLRHYVVGIPQVRASEYSAWTSAAVHVFDAADFVGVCRPCSTALVCCPCFGCDEAFDSREGALLHAAKCERQSKPPFSISELQAKAGRASAMCDFSLCGLRGGSSRHAAHLRGRASASQQQRCPAASTLCSSDEDAVLCVC